jgi:alpha-galactosidase
MLEVGNGRLTPEEERAHMAIWCLASSPLLAGNNLTAATPSVIKILTAPGPLSVNQDALALQGQLCGDGFDKNGVWQVWAKPLVGGATAALLLNRNATGTVNITLSFASCNISSKATVLTDLWSGEMLSSSSRKAWSAEVQPHSHRFVRIAPPGRNF